MSKNGKPNRLRQFHLSTAVLGMVIFGIMLLVNSHEKYRLMVEITGGESPNSLLFSNVIRVHEIGWPRLMFVGHEDTGVACLEYRYGPDNSDSLLPPRPEDYAGPLPKPSSLYYKTEWIREGVITNTLVALTILLTLSFLFEFIIRRREARKP